MMIASHIRARGVIDWLSSMEMMSLKKLSLYFQEWHPNQTCDSAHLQRTKQLRIRSNSATHSQGSNAHGTLCGASDSAFSRFMEIQLFGLTLIPPHSCWALAMTSSGVGPLGPPNHVIAGVRVFIWTWRELTELMTSPCSYFRCIVAITTRPTIATREGGQGGIATKPRRCPGAANRKKLELSKKTKCVNPLQYR